MLILPEEKLNRQALCYSQSPPSLNLAQGASQGITKLAS